MVKKIGISLGDPSGISPEILVKGSRFLPESAYIVYGSKKPVDRAVSYTGVDFRYEIIETPEKAKENGFYLVNLIDDDFIPGKPSDKTGRASVVYLKKATKDILAGKIDALVTLPISKKHIIASGFKFPGHTDYLAYVSGTENYLMMLMCDKMKVALATAHIPLKDVPEAVKKMDLHRAVKLLYRELREKFLIDNPSIAVLGLNPHAGDGGNIGREEIEIIEPVVKVLKKEGINLEGPLPPDTAFTDISKFDAFFAMYHDQGLIPLKMACFKKAVNITLGLPFIRTSPDHGTAFDIAGKNSADPSSFVEAVKLAVELSKRY